MREPDLHPERHAEPEFALVAQFADFYEEVAGIKRAQAEGRLAAYLGMDGAPAPAPADKLAADKLANEQAQRVAARLLKLLRQQERNTTADAASEAGRLERKALYVMAALADEILIFELVWPGREVWLTVLLEQAMFDSSNAGSRFFSMAQQLLQDNIRSRLHIDLAAVFLLAMELGFKGCLRARQGQTELAAMRHRLYQFVTASPSGDRGGSGGGIVPAFAEAYDYPLQGLRDERLAPVSPWRNLGLYGLLGYVLASAVLWLALMYPFERYIGA